MIISKIPLATLYYSAKVKAYKTMCWSPNIITIMFLIKNEIISFQQETETPELLAREQKITELCFSEAHTEFIQ